MDFDKSDIEWLLTWLTALIGLIIQLTQKPHNKRKRKAKKHKR